MKEAYLYKKLKDKKTQCQTCSHYCVIEEGKRGICGVRENKGGKLFSLVYSKACAVNIDPVEKKPLFHFLPGSKSLSIATVGCNFQCKNCFLPGTYVINQDGPIAIDEIFNSSSNPRQRKDGSVITDINPHQTITHKGSSQKITHGFKHPFEGEIIKIKPFYVPEIKCTPSHEFFVLTDPLAKKIKKIRAGYLAKSHYLAIPKKYHFPKKEIVLDLKAILSIVPLGKYNKKRKISEKQANQILELSKKMTSREIGKLFGLHPGYVRTLRSKLKKGKIFSTLKEIRLVEKNNKIKFTNEREYIPRFIKLDKNFAKLLGYYCGEGHVFKLKNRPNSYRLIFSFGRRERSKVEETKKLFKKIFGITPSIVEERTTLTSVLGKTSVALLFKTLCGTHALNKKIPHIINQSPKEIVYSFLTNYIACDGCYIKNDAISINTISKNLALGIYWLWLKMGFLPSFYKWIPSSKTKIENRIVNQSPLYYVKLKAQKFRDRFLFPNKKLKLNPESEKSIKFLENNKYWFVPIWKISKEKYSGWVYNMEVTKEHSYLANFIAVGNCQNWQISQGPKIIGKIEGEEIPPNKIVELALKNNLPSISYTYTEPTVFLEYALDTMKLAKKAGLKNTWVTNGFLSKETLELIAPYLDAVNVDLKSFSDDFYQKYCGGRLQPVLNTLKRIKTLQRGASTELSRKSSGQEKIWVEITTLVIPTLNDSKQIFQKIAEFIKKELGLNTPWHISRFSGLISWKLQNLPDTPNKTLETAYEIGKKTGLKYVYTGNVPGLEGEDTYCPKCKTKMIERTGYLIQRYDKNGKCSKCQESLNIIE